MHTVATEQPRQDDVLEMLRLGNEFALSLYSADCCYMLDVSELEASHTTVFVARGVGEALGMAAVVDRGDGTAELKRMFVHDRARGQGVAGEILNTAESHAGARGIHTVQLETGPKQQAAIALYEKHGYGHIPNFGPYVGDDFSVCMEKRL